MAAEKPKKSTAKTSKVFDVAHPDDTVVSATSRPVIVGHTNTMKNDPMVSPTNQPAEEAPAEDDQNLSAPKREKTILPPSQAVEEPAGEVEEAAKDPVVTEVVEDTENTEQSTADEGNTEETGGEVSEDEQPQDENIKSGTAAVDALVSGVNTKKDRIDAEDKQKQHETEIKSLIASRKYFVKIRTPERTRKIQWVVLLVLVVVAAAGWYLYLGPGRSLWDSDKKDPTPVASTQPPSADNKSQSDEAKDDQTQSTTATFSDPEAGISFTHPSTWKVEKSVDPADATVIVISLIAPNEERVLSSTSEGQATEVSAEVFLRGRIAVRATPPDTQSDVYAVCVSEGLTVGGVPGSAFYTSTLATSQAVSSMFAGTGNCNAVDAGFVIDNSVTLTSAAASKILQISSEYVLSAEYLQKNGTSDEAAIAVAQQDGVLLTKDVFAGGVGQQAFVETLKSIKVL